MASSNYIFDRWNTRYESSWAWSIFKQHNHEFLKMFRAFDNSYKYTFSNLKEHNAKLTDPINIHFKFPPEQDTNKCLNLEEWVDSYNQFENWTNLNALVSLLSTLEIYMATIIPLAVESDIGVLYGIPHSMDGITILKHNKKKPHGLEEIVTNCTKGTWDSRVNAYKKIFDTAPIELEKNISELDKMRCLRNDIAHAFGRNIESARDQNTISIQPSKKLKREKLLKYQRIIWETAKSIDDHLYPTHVGEYLNLLFFHKLYADLDPNLHPNQKAVIFKKEIGKFGRVIGKKFCFGLVAYYESL